MRTRLAFRPSGASGSGMIVREISTSLGRSRSVYSRQSIQSPPSSNGEANMSWVNSSGTAV